MWVWLLALLMRPTFRLSLMLSSRGTITRLIGANGSRVKQPVNHLDNGCNLPDN
jgi:hypothetical protein